MKKFRFSFLLVMLFLLPQLLLTASAHPGRTDSQGGHWDHSNGTYHYHDGSSAGKSSSSSSSSSDGYASRDYSNGYSSGYRAGREKGYKDAVKELQDDIKAAEDAAAQAKSDGQRGAFIISGTIGAIVFIFMRLGIRWRNQEIDDWRGRYQKCLEENEDLTKRVKSLTEELGKEKDANLSLDRLQQQYHNMYLDAKYALDEQAVQIETLEAQLLNTAAQRQQLLSEFNAVQENLLLLKGEDTNAALQLAHITREGLGLPDNIDLTIDLLPTTGLCTQERPFGNYTVYISEHGKVYHIQRGCRNSYIPAHCYDVIDTRVPCSLCGKDLRYYMRREPWYAALQAKRKSLGK